MTQQSKPPDDTFQIRCSKLGHQIHFSYCRKENFGIPCVRILTCWYTHFSVEKYLRKDLSEEQWQEAFEKPVKPKVLSLVELIQQAEKAKKQEQK